MGGMGVQQKEVDGNMNHVRNVQGFSRRSYLSTPEWLCYNAFAAACVACVASAGGRPWPRRPGAWGG